MFHGYNRIEFVVVFLDFFRHYILDFLFGKFGFVSYHEVENNVRVSVALVHSEIVQSKPGVDFGYYFPTFFFNRVEPRTRSNDGVIHFGKIVWSGR